MSATTETTTTELRASMLVYDIPAKSKVANPSDQLRRFGFRANLSCWVIPTASLPHNLITELRESGVNAKVVPFDVSAGPQLVTWAIEQLRADAEEQVKRTRANLEKAGDKHLDGLSEVEAVTGERREEALAAYELRAGAICKRLEDILAHVTEAAAGFGIESGALNLGGARAAFDAFQTGYTARAAEFAAATEKLRAAAAASGDANAAALANAAAQDLVPVAVLAGGLEDAGLETDAARLTQAFDDGTFSLSDAE